MVGNKSQTRAIINARKQTSLERLTMQFLNAQMVLDLQVIATPLQQTMDAIDSHLQMFKEIGDARHLQIAQMLVQAIDNAHGEFAYANYKTTGEKFW